jgi:hypothetical protein
MITGRIRRTFIYPDQSTLLQANRQVANRSKSPIVAKRTRSPYSVRALVEVAVSEWITQDEAESMLILPSRIPSHQDRTREGHEPNCCLGRLCSKYKSALSWCGQITLLLVVHARDDQRVHLALGYVHKLYYSRAKQLVDHLAK